MQTVGAKRPSREACLGVSSLSVRFGALRVLQDIDLVVERGERRCVIGPNGAGKTTFFNALAGVVQPTSGTVRLFGQDISRMKPHRRAALGMSRTFQRTKLFPELSVMQNLLLSMLALRRTRFQAVRRASRLDQLQVKAREHLARFDLVSEADRLVASMGYGEQRRIEILMAMVQEPKLLLLDEPTAGLSAADGHIVTEILAACDDDMTMLMIEHDMSVVFEVASRLTVLSAGKVVADGTVDEVRANPAVQDVYLGGSFS